MQLAGRQREMADDEFIVSKTDLKGRVAYANDVFLSIADLGAGDVLGQPHSIIRHERMPRCIFKLLWDTVQSGQEIFAYVVNRAKSGDYYWVFAHVTPSFGPDGTVTGYHSNRRKPRAEAVAKIQPLYAELLAEEQRHRNAKQGLAASFALLQQVIAKEGGDYERFVLAL